MKVIKEQEISVQRPSGMVDGRMDVLKHEIRNQFEDEREMGVATFSLFSNFPEKNYLRSRGRGLKTSFREALPPRIWACFLIPSLRARSLKCNLIAMEPQQIENMFGVSLTLPSQALK